MGKALSARQTNSYLLSFQDYLSIPEAVRLLQRCHLESLGPDAHLVSGNRAASSSSSCSVSERSDETANRKLEQESLSHDKENADDPLADLPFWFEDSTENLEATELLAPAHSARDLEHPVEVVTKSRRHSIETHFPKDRNCHVCLGTKITKASCRRRKVR